MKPGITAHPTTWPIRLGPDERRSIEHGIDRTWTTVGPELDFYKNNPDHIGRSLP